MRNKTKKILIALGLVFAFLSINSYNIFSNQREHDGTKEVKAEINLKNPKESEYWNLQFIHIDNNWSATASTYDWCKGDGSWSNPYTIENITINASGSPTGSGIYIENSNEYFILRNCTVYNSGTDFFDDGGIKLQHTNNGILIGNNCSNNGDSGILLSDYCNNNTISGNKIGNNRFGIILLFYQDNTIIIGNTLYNNSIFLLDSNKAELSGNKMENCGVIITGSLTHSSSYIIHTNNTVNGRPVYYYVNKSGLGAANFTGAGQVLLVNCNNSVISNLNISHTPYAIYLSDCNNNTISGNTLNYNGDGIFFNEYCDGNTILGNTLNYNAGDGIFLGNRECDNNIISGNTANYNYQGIELNSAKNTFSGNTLNYNYYGISLSGFLSANNTISGNTANYNSYGIFLYGFCNNNTISGNIVNNNTDLGVYLYEECVNNNILGNNASYNGNSGICLDYECDNNIISGNTANNNRYGIDLGDNCDNNTISGNKIDNNSYGISLANSRNSIISENIMNKCGLIMSGSLEQLSSHNIDITNLVNGKSLYYYSNELNLGSDNFTDAGQVILVNCNDSLISNLNLSYCSTGISLIYCNNNTISGNTANNNINTGIKLYFNCDNNIILGNTINNNSAGISLHSDCNNNTISGNILNNNNQDGINLDTFCDNNTIFGNTIYYNEKYGVYLTHDCNNNNFAENFIYFNKNGAFDINSTDCDQNRITRNVMVSEDELFINDGGTDTIISMNYELISPPQLYIGIIDQLFSMKEFAIIINVNSEFCFDFSIQKIEMWWNGIAVPSDNITDLGNNLYNISLTPIFVEIGEDPILLNMTISALHHRETYFEMYVAVEPCEIVKFLQLEITEHFYSTEHFNFTFFISNETGYGIEFATLQMWWNGVDVSSDVQDLGGGYYFVSLDAITVAPGEDPILLNMTISASGYEDKYFETYIAVSPIDLIEDTLELEIIDQSFSTEQFNLTFFIHNTTGYGIEFATIQMWWNGVDVSSDVKDLGSGLYFISLDAITVAPGDDPILLNMTISASGFEDKYFETFIAVSPSDLIEDTLELEVIDQSFSTEQFNMTFFICNTTGYGIEFATIQMWWNGVDVSSDVQNLGNGLYFISLESITVNPGEEPILLSMIISASGYEDKSFESYIAVDPASLLKGEGRPSDGFPLALTIILSAIGAGAIIGVISIYWFKRRKRKAQ